MQKSSIVCVIFDHSLHFSTIVYINLDYSLQFSYTVYSSQPLHAILDTLLSSLACHIFAISLLLSNMSDVLNKQEYLKYKSSIAFSPQKMFECC